MKFLPVKLNILNLLCFASTLFFLSSSNVSAQLNFSPIKQYKCIYKVGKDIVINGTCKIYLKHNGYDYTIQWPDGIGTGIDRNSDQTVIIDKSKKAKFVKDSNYFYFYWYNKLAIVSRFPK